MSTTKRTPAKQPAEVKSTSASPAKTAPADPQNTRAAKKAASKPEAEEVKDMAEQTQENAEVETQQERKKQKTNYRDLGLSFAPARVRNLVAKQINGSINAMVGTLLQKSKEETDQNKLNELQEQIKVLNAERVRLAATTSLSIATICEYLVKEIAKFSAEKCTADGKKIIQLKHFINQDLESLSVYPFIKSLPIMDGIKEKIAELETSKKATNPKGSSARDESQPAAEQPEEGQDNTHDNARDAAQVDDQADTKQDEVAAEESTDSVFMFKTYVTESFKNAMPSNGTSNRVSQNIIKFLSELIYQFVLLIARLSQLTVKFMKSKTINSSTVKFVVELLLATNADYRNVVELVKKDGTEKFAVNHFIDYNTPVLAELFQLIKEREEAFASEKKAEDSDDQTDTSPEAPEEHAA
mgnify:CR=1 FL=1